MTDAPATDRPSRWWRRIPEPLWWAVLPVAAGFVVAWPRTTRTASGSCSFVDQADVVAGGLAVVLVVTGVVAHLRRAPGRRCPTQLLLGLVVLLGGLGVYHLLTGLGHVGGPCG